MPHGLHQLPERHLQGEVYCLTAGVPLHLYQNLPRLLEHATPATAANTAGSESRANKVVTPQNGPGAYRLVYVSCLGGSGSLGSPVCGLQGWLHILQGKGGVGLPALREGSGRQDKKVTSVQPAWLVRCVPHHSGPSICRTLMPASKVVAACNGFSCRMDCCIVWHACQTRFRAAGKGSSEGLDLTRAQALDLGAESGVAVPAGKADLNGSLWEAIK